MSGLTNESYENSVLIGHPNQQHSMELATAMNRAGLLSAYITTVFYKKNSLLMMLLPRLSSKMFRKCERKSCGELDKKTKVYNHFSAMLFYFLLGKKQKLSYRIYVSLTKKFGKKVAKYAIRHSCSAVVMYDYTAVSCFEYLQTHAPGIRRILDMSSIPSVEIDKIISYEEAQGRADMFVDKRYRYHKENCRYYARELSLAECFLSPSDFVDKALLKNGVRSSQLYRVSYGVNLHDFTFHRKEVGEKDVVNFVFAGKIEAAKGVYYMMEAFNAVHAERNDFHLYLVGENYMGKDLFENKTYVTMVGYLNKAELIALYQKMHIFVMPSLWEGKSLSVMEALSSGLCQIVSDSSGADEYVSASGAGIVIPPQNTDALTEAIKWYLDNKEKISEMSEKAGQSVMSTTWEQYYVEAVKKITEILSSGKTERRGMRE